MPPVLLERNRFEIVGSVRGDVGLREALAAHPEAVRAVDVGGDLPDVDSPGDLARLDNRDG
jgi:CTP:molybdopterin cytidylyltransferase MocA